MPKSAARADVVTGKDDGVRVGRALSSDHLGLASGRHCPHHQECCHWKRTLAGHPVPGTLLRTEQNLQHLLSQCLWAGSGSLYASVSSLSDGDKDALLSKGASEGFLSPAKIDCRFA